MYSDSHEVMYSSFTAVWFVIAKTGNNVYVHHLEIDYIIDGPSMRWNTGLL